MAKQDPRGSKLRRSLQQIQDQDPQQIVHPTVEHVHGLEEVAYGMDELVVLCLLRDGRPYVRSFVEHYSSMGAKHLVFLDNGSTDGTVEALKEYANVTVLRTELPFKGHQGVMKRYLIDRFGRGRWSLLVDIDEFFDYPYSDVIGLDSLLGYLNGNSYTAVAAQMLDMFPERPLSGRASSLDENLIEVHRFYDISNLRRRRITEHRRQPPGNTYASSEIEAFSRGIRWTVFGVSAFLTKHPLVFLDGNVKPMPPHWVSNARVADFTGVLLHYKFLADHLHKQATQAPRARSPEARARYNKYLEALEETPDLVVKGEAARELKSVNDLVDNGFLVVSEEYMMLAYDEERKGTGHAPPRDEPGRAEDEALHKARVEAKVQRLRAQRLEREVEVLREWNQTLRERNQKFKEQNQRLLAEKPPEKSLLRFLTARWPLAKLRKREQKPVPDTKHNGLRGELDEPEAD
jgi:hypothetical protein